MTKSKKPDSLLKVWDRQKDDEERKRLGLPPNRDEENQMEEEKEKPQPVKRSTISITAIHHKNLKFVAAQADMSLTEAVDRIFDRLFNDFEGLTVKEMKQWGDRVRSLNE